jgi:flagellar hook-associated protein 3 FlgL
MRITQSISYRNFLAGVENLNEAMENASRQVSSGKKLTRLKDSPSGSAELLVLRKQLTDIDQYRSNTDSSVFFLNVADSALNSVHDLVTTIFTRGSAAGSGTIDADARASLATEIRFLRDQVFSLANTQTRGRSLFAGSEVTTAAFTIAGDAVTYQGNSEINSIDVGESLEIRQNLSGSAIFTPIFDAITTLLQAVDSGDIAAIQAGVTQLNPALSGLSNARIQLGVDLSRLEDIKTEHDAQALNIRARRGRIEDANLAEAITDLTQIQTALRASLSAQGTIQPRNLFDYLG